MGVCRRPSCSPAGWTAPHRPRKALGPRTPGRHRPVQRLPVIGYPLGHTPTEGVLGAAFQAAGIEMEIERWERKPHQLTDAIAALREEGIAGALVGSPHKERIPPLVNALSDDARTSGAVNVVIRDGERLRGHN